MDRDGIINYDKGYTYKIEEFCFKEEIFEICRYFASKGYIIIVVTNQAGIGRGFYSEEEFEQLTQWMIGEFEKKGIFIEEVFFCPYHATHGIGKYKMDSFDRKPNPGMFLKAIDKYGIDPSESFALGDKESDMIAAQKSEVANRILISEQEGQGSCTKKYSSLEEYVRDLDVQR